MNCPECSSRSKTWGVRKHGTASEANYRLCPKCGARWTEYRRILLHSVKRSATHRLKALR